MVPTLVENSQFFSVLVNNYGSFSISIVVFLFSNNVYRIEGKLGAGLNLTNLTIANFSQPNFILARDHPDGEYDIHERRTS